MNLKKNMNERIRFYFFSIYIENPVAAIEIFKYVKTMTTSLFLRLKRNNLIQKYKKIFEI